MDTPGGTRTRTSGLRARCHRPSTTGARSSGGRGRTCASRVTVARLTDSTTPEQRRQQDSNLRGGGPPYAVARRCLPNSAMSPRRKERESNPQGPFEPTRFRDGVPRPWQSFQSDFGRRRTCNLPIKSRVLCRVELRSQATWSAGIEPAAPRVSSGRSTGLSYDHTWARLGSNQRPPVCKTGARTD
jgi:hypothetical protein